MIKAAEFIKNHGMDAVEIDLDKYTKALFAEMQAGLEKKTDTVPMLPTYLRGEKQIPKGKKAAVIDAGGTNFRTALVSFEKDGVKLEKLEKHSMPGATEPATWEEFISHTAQCIMPLMDETDVIGFCFSYPAEPTPDMDSRVISMTKQVKIEGAEGKMIGAALKAELERLGAGNKKIVVLNDTPAALLGGTAAIKKSLYGGFIGLVAGTGVNCCCMLPDRKVEKLGLKGNEKMLVNLESGSFNGFARGEFDLELDKALPDTGEYTAEKMCSGRYLGEICLRTLKAAAEEGVFSESGSKFIAELEFLDTPTADKWATGRRPKALSAEDSVNLVYIISNMFERSARCICCVLCAILMLTGEGTDKPVCISADGSLFKKSRLFRPYLEDFMAVYADEIMGRSYEFITSEETSLVGSAAAALLN